MLAEPTRQSTDDSVATTDPSPTRLPIAILKADPRNPRKMAPEATSGLAISMETFGPLDIVFNQRTGELVSGHQRIDRLKAAGATELVREGEWGYIAHPKTGERFPVRFVEWDETKQRMETSWPTIRRCRGISRRRRSTRRGLFMKRPISRSLVLQNLQRTFKQSSTPNGLTNPGADTATRTQYPSTGRTITKLGDLWELGDHRILCGDSTSAEDVARLMGDERAVMMATDPPYLVDYTADNHPASAERQKAGKDGTANKNWDAYKDPKDERGILLRLHPSCT